MDDIAQLLTDLPPDRPVLIAGATASGKSNLALQIARDHGGIIVNADALQVYDGWRVLSARPTAQDEAAVPHALYGHVPLTLAYSVGAWLRDLAPILARDGTVALRPIITGGTGLYFSALTEGLTEIPPIPAPIRAEGNRLRLTEPGAMEQTLRVEDPVTADHIDMRNPMRVQRAWEVLRATGRGLRSWQNMTPPPLLPLSETLPLVVERDRDDLTARIEARFAQMVAGGALEEVRAALPHWDDSAPASRAIGAPELRAHLLGHTSLEVATERACIATRQFAKRQRTWFRNRFGDWHRVAPFI